MKNPISLLTFIFLFLFSSQLVSQSRDVGNFTGIHASSSVSVTLVKANAAKIEFEMIKGSAEDLVTKVKDGTLIVKTKSNKLSWGNSAQAKVTVYYTELDEISARSGCSLKSDNTIVADDMEINVSSGSSAKLDVDANSIEVEVSSGSTLKLKGEANKGSFEARSGSTLNAYYFETEKADVEARSGSSLSIHVDDSIKGEASSGSSIKYTGSASNADIETDRSASVSRKN